MKQIALFWIDSMLHLRKSGIFSQGQCILDQNKQLLSKHLLVKQEVHHSGDLESETNTRFTV